jgi:hypothetical protein
MKRLCVLLIFISSVIQPAFYGFAEIRLLGHVSSTGKFETRVGAEGWAKMEGIYPIETKAYYRTTDGMLSFIFKDGTRINMGEVSEAVLEGKIGDYALDVRKGKFAFYVPEGSSLSVKTPDALIEAGSRGSLISKVSSAENCVIGGVYFDGKETRIVAIAGQIKINSDKGGEIMELGAGKAVIFSSNAKEYRVLPVSSSPDPAIGLTLPLLAAGGAAILGTGAAIWESENSNASNWNNLQSPYSP